MAGEKLIGIMNSIRSEDKSDTTDLLFGTVSSISPLKIKIDNRYEITQEFIILSALCKQTVISVPAHSHSYSEGQTGTALTSITLWRGLQTGDRVRILRFNKGQSFYVLEREAGVL